MRSADDVTSPLAAACSHESEPGFVRAFAAGTITASAWVPHRCSPTIAEAPTERHVPAQAGGALAARGRGVDHHLVTEVHAVDSVADRVDDAGAVGSADVRERRRGGHAASHPEVEVVEGRGAHGHPHLAGPGLRIGDLAEHVRAGPRRVVQHPSPHPAMVRSVAAGAQGRCGPRRGRSRAMMPALDIDELQRRSRARSRGRRVMRARLEMVVRRPAEDEREVVTEARIEPGRGLVGDSWSSRAKVSPEAEVTLMNARCIALLAGSRDRWPLAGDQLYVDLDLSELNLPAGSRLRVGEAVLEVSAKPHRGCAKFAARFGDEALRFVNSEPARAARLRGLNARVVEARHRAGRRRHREGPRGRVVSDSYPRQAARTRSFNLGLPRAFRIADDGARVAFLRSRAGDDPVAGLWVLDVDDGHRARGLPSVGHRGTPHAGRDRPTRTDRREAARRDRLHRRSRPADGGVRLRVTPWCRSISTTGAARPLETHGRPFDPRLDADGRRVAYETAGSLRVLDLGRATTSCSPATTIPTCGGVSRSSSRPRRWNGRAGTGGRPTVSGSSPAGSTTARCGCATSPPRSIPRRRPASCDTRRQARRTRS